jgi:hypothetical protein
MPTGITLSDDEKFFMKKMAEKKKKIIRGGYGTRYVGH